MFHTHTMSRRAGIAFVLLFLAGASTRADLVQWAYNWQPSATKIMADGGGSGYLTLTNDSVKTTVNSSNTVITNLRSVSTATSAAPDTFTHAPVSFTMHLEDLASKATGSVTFSGFFSGMLTSTNANIAANFTSPTTQTLTLGGNTYTVSLGLYSPPGPPDATNAGSLNAVVSVTPGDGSGHIGGEGAAEPSTLILASLALPYFGLTGWRSRNKRVRMSPVA